MEGANSTVDSQIQHHLKNAGRADEFGQDNLKWMCDEALNRASYNIARAFDPDKDAQFIRENRVGMGAPTMLTMVNGKPFDTRSPTRHKLVLSPGNQQWSYDHSP